MIVGRCGGSLVAHQTFWGRCPGFEYVNTASRTVIKMRCRITLQHVMYESQRGRHPLRQKPKK